MKRCVKRIALSCYGVLPARSGVIVPATGVTLTARARTHQTVDDDAIVSAPGRCGSTRSPSIQLAGLDQLRHDGAVRRHRHDDMLRLVGHDRGGRDQQDRRRADQAQREAARTGRA